jgi:helicase
MDSLEIEDGLERAFKQAYIFGKWMDETHDDVLYDKYAVPPGVLRGKLNIMDWLLYASSEISRITNKDQHSHQVLTLRRRLKYGVKKELLPLVSVRGIGRIRARKLYTAGIKDKIGLKKSGVEKISSLIGKKTAEKILTVLDKDDY